MLLAVNSLLQYGENPKQIERILWMDAKRINCYAIDIFSDRYPMLKSLREIEQGILEGTIHVADQEQWFAPVCDDLLSEKAREHMETAWSIIEKIAVSENEPAIFEPHLRKQLIKEAADSFSVSEKTVGRYLRTFWRKGKTKYALAPSFEKRGGRGKPKASGQAKRGRPRKYSQGEGINITGDVEQIFVIVSSSGVKLRRAS
ncbi:hypothetical protein [Cohnella thermotolerans]|uniref:hypothetical protein n=1 Tax=Cohnella thermotolerans TaxID=329858 RepID=UPI000479A7C5|nr:hypothetical protein [Cohnella thermotolerans]